MNGPEEIQAYHTNLTQLEKKLHPLRIIRERLRAVALVHCAIDLLVRITQQLGHRERIVWNSLDAPAADLHQHS